MAKDQLARGARSATYGNAGVGESPLLLKLAEEESNPTPVEEPARAFERQDRPVRQKRFTPLGATILVKQAPSEVGEAVYTDQQSALADKTSLIVGVASEETVKADVPAEGTVVAVGPGTKDITMTVEAGDYIVFGKYAGAAYKHNGEWMLLMQVNEVLGILNDSEE